MNFSLGLSPVTAIYQGADRVWPVANISITSGSGYVGSVYTSTIADQWYADGVAIPGETGATFTMTAEYEGAAIKCGNSNVIRMWMPSDLASVNAVWDALYGVTESGGTVTDWGARFGGARATQVTASRQPALQALGGLMWLDFDGAYERLETDVYNGTTREVHLGVRVSSANAATNQIVYGAMSGASNSGGIDSRSYVAVTSDGYLSMCVGNMTTGSWSPHENSIFDTDVVVGFSHDAAGNLSLYVDGVSVGTTVNTGHSAPLNPSRIADLNHPLWDDFNTKGRFYGICDVPQILSDADRANVISWLAARQGRVL
ncbi:hypothetical protein [Celeribacter halophilus]|uniref:hypothetical protein n=1 Tax=Celeribacter halophilus TaxID=576117 RepID=UPI003A8F664B